MGASCAKEPNRTPYEYDEKIKNKAKKGGHKYNLTEDEQADLDDFLEDIIEQADLRLSLALNSKDGQKIINEEVAASNKSADIIKKTMHQVVRKRLVRKATRQWLDALAQSKEASTWIEENPNQSFKKKENSNQSFKLRKKYSKRRLTSLANKSLAEDNDTSFSSAGESDFDDYEFLGER